MLEKEKSRSRFARDVSLERTDGKEIEAKGIAVFVGSPFATNGLGHDNLFIQRRCQSVDRAKQSD
jgi:hypothetical protein